MYILKHYIKPENKTDNNDFTKFGMKISPVQDLQELPITPKRAKLQLNSLLRQNSVDFVTDFTQTMNKFTQALLACSYIFPPLVSSAELE